MLTEHEQLADHEARISRQELPPLQQPLDNIEEIRQALNNEWQPWETAPKGEQNVLWYVPEEKRYMVGNKRYLSYVYYEDCENWVWKHLPPPPKEQK